MAERAAVERLVRETLGCTCPTEVFDRIEEGRVSLPGVAAPVRHLAIGGRLLVYLIEAEDPAQAASSLPTWVTVGQAQRDAAGMSRVRLVVLAAHPEVMTPLLRATWETLGGLDERVHLHVLPTDVAAGIP